jgi:hypothetical protein
MQIDTLNEAMKTHGHQAIGGMANELEALWVRQADMLEVRVPQTVMPENVNTFKIKALRIIMARQPTCEQWRELADLANLDISPAHLSKKRYTAEDKVIRYISGKLRLCGIKNKYVVNPIPTTAVSVDGACEKERQELLAMGEAEREEHYAEKAKQKQEREEEKQRRIQRTEEDTIAMVDQFSKLFFATSAAVAAQAEKDEGAVGQGVSESEAVGEAPAKKPNPQCAFVDPNTGERCENRKRNRKVRSCVLPEHRFKCDVCQQDFEYEGKKCKACKNL